MQTKIKEIIIDAENKPLGRVAVEAAISLRGKNSAQYLPNVNPKNKVKVINAGKIKITGKKLKQKKYKRYSGYPGSLRYTPLEKAISKDPKKLFKKVVSGMLPKNKLADKILKNLIIEL